MMHAIPMADYVIHFLLEALGGGICVCAYRFCPHRVHRALVWFTLSALTTFITVQAVG